MKNFMFYNPVKIIFGKGELTKLKELIISEKKVLILYGGGSIKKNGVYDGVLDALQGYSIYEFSGIEPNPRYETCLKVVELIKKEEINFILAVGGGSVIDAAKFIAAAVDFKDGDPWDILAKGVKPKSALPFGVVLTLPATGSEMNSGSVITRDSTKEKFAFGSPVTFPQFSILLPDAAATLPKRQVANGVADAFVHVVEQYVNYPVNTPIQDRFAEAILKTLLEIGPKVVENPEDYDLMSNLMWSATMALNGLIGVAVPQDWGIHMIGHELTALHEIDHARTLAIVLPGYWDVFRNEKKEKILQYGERVLGLTTGNEEERINAIIVKTEEFFNSLGIATKLSDYDVKEDSIIKISNRFMERNWLKLGDRGLVTPDKVKEVLYKQLA
ncbi:MAG TPA: iron-containing alcohol dehydrogenase [Melioribacteraceae bacterium]|nr:iron-containing alcohol dehydrogenase [Melioribacteraceae bacterium]